MLAGSYPKTFRNGLAQRFQVTIGHEPSRDTDAAAAFDQAIDALTQTYFRELPEIATYAGAPPALAPGAKARLTDRFTEAESVREPFS